MRIWLAILGAALTACQRQAATPADAPPVSFDGAQVIQASARIAHGDRLTHVLGCRGCHAPTLEGQRFYELYASNLTREVPKYTDAQLDRLIRRGIHPTRAKVWGMPSEIFQHLTDHDFAALRSFLRTLTPSGAPTGQPLPFEPETRKLIASGDIMPAAAAVQKSRTVTPVDVGGEHALGRYITEVTCAECHGPKLEGHAGDTPDLAVAGSYTRAEFETLLTKGVLPGGRKFKNELMGMVARNRFSYLTTHERDALYAYLKARAERPQ